MTTKHEKQPPTDEQAPTSDAPPASTDDAEATSDEEAGPTDETTAGQDADPEEDGQDVDPGDGEDAELRRRGRPQTRLAVDEEVPLRLLSIVESLLFAAQKPLKPAQLQKLLGERSPARLMRVVKALIEQRADQGIVVTEVDGGYQLRTNPENARWVRRLEEIKPVRMSRASLEVVAVVAYRQPVTRAEIDQIRGVDSGGSLKQLLSRDLVRILGRKEEPGRPFVYGTTHEFLSFFSLSSLSELPPLRAVTELAASSDDTDEETASVEGTPDAEETTADAEEGTTETAQDDSARDGGPRPPARPMVPPEVTPEEIEADEDEFEEMDEGDDEVFEALAAASDAARGADRVRRTLKKMAAAEAEAGPSSPEAGRMLESIEQLVAARRKRKGPPVEGEEDAQGDGTTPPADGKPPADGEPPASPGAAAPSGEPAEGPPDGSESP